MARGGGATGPKVRCCDCGTLVAASEAIRCYDCGRPLCGRCGEIGLCSDCEEVMEYEDYEDLEEGGEARFYREGPVRWTVA
ncbi:TPA: hypothetical protein EYP44_04640 [Candidatus Bathyarchaeota archaeon]|nr:hypothetical protein [Candidatus Bathyarchaeota archaeon]